MTPFGFAQGRRLVAVSCVYVMLAVAAVYAQQAAPNPAPTPTPAAPAAPAPPAGAQAPPAAPPPPQESYTYEAQGRRDPFLSVLGTGIEPKLSSKRGAGPAGMLTSDIAVRGVMQNGSSFTALVVGPDQKTYMVHAGDKLLDGTVKAVTSDGLTIVQDVNDPLSLVKTREVRKLLRSREDARP